MERSALGKSAIFKRSISNVSDLSKNSQKSEVKREKLAEILRRNQEIKFKKEAVEYAPGKFMERKKLTNKANSIMYEWL